MSPSKAEKESAVRWLSKNALLHMDMLESIAGGNADLLYVSENGVLLLQTTSGAYMMSAQDEGTAEAMLAKISDVSLFVAHQDFYISAVQEKYSLPRRMECFQAAYLKNESFPDMRVSASIRTLDESFLPFLMRHYTHADNPEYLHGRLKSGSVFGAFLGDDLAGFIGMHEEGSMGMLEVLPQYRRRGIGAALETYLCSRILSKGRIPFAQIETANQVSLALHQKLNFSISSQTLSWLMK